ncbi:MAG: hypothetical protein MI742_05950 [Desulfobacterales bacterium]|nr:hypothetical protein [Desulfobacterales bacterium]
MKDSANLHQKIQELCDCFAESDILSEMSRMQTETPSEEAALKWLALAMLHGIGNSAHEITLKHDDQGVRVLAEYRLTDLPAPPKEIAIAAVAALRKVTHITEAKGKSPLAFGFRENSMDLSIKIKEGGGKCKATIGFP